MGEEGVEVWRQQCLNVIEHVGSDASPEGSTPAQSPILTLYNVSESDHACTLA